MKTSTDYSAKYEEWFSGKDDWDIFLGNKLNNNKITTLINKKEYTEHLINGNNIKLIGNINDVLKGYEEFMSNRKTGDKYQVTIGSYNGKILKIKYDGYGQILVNGNNKGNLSISSGVNKNKLLEIISNFGKKSEILKSINYRQSHEPMFLKQTEKQKKQQEEYQERMKKIIMHSTSQ